MHNTVLDWNIDIERHLTMFTLYNLCEKKLQ